LTVGYCSLKFGISCRSRQGHLAKLVRGLLKFAYANHSARERRNDFISGMIELARLSQFLFGTRGITAIQKRSA
jgi:hypothetical protein